MQLFKIIKSIIDQWTDISKKQKQALLIFTSWQKTPPTFQAIAFNLVSLICLLNFSLWYPCLIYSRPRLSNSWDWCWVLSRFTCQGTGGQM